MKDDTSKPAIKGFWVLLALIAGILILGDLNRRMSDARRLERDAQLLATEVAQLEAEQIQLKTQIAGSDSEELVGEWARSEAKMVREGERLVVPVPMEGALITPTPTPQPFLEPPANWEVWWALLGGG